MDYFFNANPKDYFFIDPNRRVKNISKEKFAQLVEFMMRGFHKHNTKLTNILRRGLARRLAYSEDFGLFLSDCRKALGWIIK